MSKFGGGKYPKFGGGKCPPGKLLTILLHIKKCVTRVEDRPWVIILVKSDVLIDKSVTWDACQDSLDIVDSPRCLNQLSGEHYTIIMADDAGPYEVTISPFEYIFLVPNIVVWNIAKEFTGLAGGWKVKIWPGMGLASIYIWIRGPLEILNGSRTPEMDSNRWCDN